MIKLRPYQREVIDKARHTMRRSIRRYMIVLPTGGGKTAISTHIIGETAARGMTAFFLCHRVELLDQTEATFQKAGIGYGLIAAGRPYEPDRTVYIGSIDTVRRRLDRIPRPDLLVIDEAAHTPANTWRQVVDTWPDAWRIGLTATPQRLSGEGFEDIFDELVTGPSVADLIAQGWLAPYKMYAPPGVDPIGLRVRAGDYIPTEAAALVNRPTITGSAIEHYRRLSEGKRAVVFCAGVEHSKNVANDFNAAGYPAKHVDGTTPPDERRQAMEDFRAGRLLILTNCNLFVEGVDVPALETCILLRPTRSLSLYLQAVGRALRPGEGKTALILDHVGACAMHGMPDEPHKWTLYGRARQSRAANDNDPAPVIRVCDTCYAAFKPAACCPYCGAVSKPSAREIQQREGELAEVQRIETQKEARREVGRARSLPELIEIGRNRGYKNPAWWAQKIHNGRARKGVSM